MAGLNGKEQAVILLDKRMKSKDPLRVYLSNQTEPVLFDPQRDAPQGIKERFERFKETLGLAPKQISVKDLADRIQSDDMEANILIHSQGGDWYFYVALDVLLQHFRKEGRVTRAYVPYFAGSGAAFTFASASYRCIGPRAGLGFHAPVGKDGKIETVSKLRPGETVEEVIALRRQFLYDRLQSFLGNLGEAAQVRERILEDVFERPRSPDYTFFFDVQTLRSLSLAVVSPPNQMAVNFQRDTGFKLDEYPELKDFFLRPKSFLEMV